MIFKKIEQHIVTPFIASREIDVGVNNGSSEHPSLVSRIVGERRDGLFTTEDYYQNPSNIASDSNSTVFKKPFFDMVRHLFYSGDENVYRTFGIENSNELNVLDIEDTVWALKASPRAYGDCISPGSVEIVHDNGHVIKDDGSGNMIADNGVQVGNAFYVNGIVIFTKDVADASNDDIFTNFPEYPAFDSPPASTVIDFDGYKNLSYSFENEYQRFEHRVECTIDQHEFNATNNPSYKEAGVDIKPYVTTVGLYDEFNNLVAIGKLSKPLKQLSNAPLTIAIEFDT